MKPIHLYDYQEEMVGRIHDAFKRHRSVMVQMPTGTGKTIVLSNVVFSFLEKDKREVWVVAHRRELVSQIRETLKRGFSKKQPILFHKDLFSNHPVPLSKEGSTAFPKPLSPQGTGDVAAPPRCSEPLRSKVGGPSEVSPECLTQQCYQYDFRLHSASIKQAYDCSRLHENCDCLCGVNRLAGEAAEKAAGGAADILSRIKVYSIQWLTRHLDEMTEEPSLVVIDEAHHTLAKTYKVLWERFPKAKFLGLTATPCRLNGKGFTDLFDVLVCSHSVPEFIQMGRLSPFDYVSIRPDSEAQVLIDSLRKRGADGDYQAKEMDEVLNKRPSIERLYESVAQYAKGKKGIVYAISIDHAKNIADYYNAHGLHAVALSCQTPARERKEIVETFRNGNSLNIIVNVDLFGEGFDCPDVEFIQLARPTLSLAKYLQMVGRGLRVHQHKECCTIIDNVGLYKRFGLPTQRRDWQGMFEGFKETRYMLFSAPVCFNSKDDCFPLCGRGLEGEASEPLYVVVTRDTLMEALGGMSDNEQRERYKEELLSGKYGKVKSVGVDLEECVTPEKKRFFVDLRNMNRMEAKRGTAIPTRLNMSGYELVRYGQTLYSRTRIVQAIPYCKPDPKRFVRGKFFLAFDLQQALPDAPTIPNRYRKYDMTATDVCCFIQGDDAEVYHLIAALYSYRLHDSDCIIVRDSKGDYWQKSALQWRPICRGCLSQQETAHILVQAMEEILRMHENDDFSRTSHNESDP